MYSDVKITMLGPIASGKTCYMVGMYSHMQLGKNGFTLSALDPDDDLKLSNLWKRLVDDKKWPPPNDDNPYHYTLRFNYAFQPIIRVKWLDYRGGAMSNKKTATTVQHLMDHLMSSSCVFLCISGEYLVEPLTLSSELQVAEESGARRMGYLIPELEKKVKPTPQQPFPVVIILTKYDKCSHRPKEEVIADIKRLFPSLFVPDSSWLTMICPVTLGKELETTGIIQPHNVERPVAFAIYTKLRKESLYLKAGKRHREANVEQLESNFFKRIFKRDEITEQRKRIKQLEHQIAVVETNKRRLIKLGRLDRAEIFRGGGEVRID